VRRVAVRRIIMGHRVFRETRVDTCGVDVITLKKGWSERRRDPRLARGSTSLSSFPHRLHFARWRKATPHNNCRFQYSGQLRLSRASSMSVDSTPRGIVVHLLNS
jgi:hypothetical protein